MKSLCVLQRSWTLSRNQREGTKQGWPCIWLGRGLWIHLPSVRMPALPSPILHLSSVILTSSRLVGDPLQSPPLLLCVRAPGKCSLLLIPSPQTLRHSGCPGLPAPLLLGCSAVGDLCGPRLPLSCRYLLWPCSVRTFYK